MTLGEVADTAYIVHRYEIRKIPERLLEGTPNPASRLHPAPTPLLSPGSQSPPGHRKADSVTGMDGSSLGVRRRMAVAEKVGRSLGGCGLASRTHRTGGIRDVRAVLRPLHRTGASGHRRLDPAHRGIPHLANPLSRAGIATPIETAGINGNGQDVTQVHGDIPSHSRG